LKKILPLLKFTKSLVIKLTDLHGHEPHWNTAFKRDWKSKRKEQDCECTNTRIKLYSNSMQIYCLVSSDYVSTNQCSKLHAETRWADGPPSINLHGLKNSLHF